MVQIEGSEQIEVSEEIERIFKRRGLGDPYDIGLVVHGPEVIDLGEAKEFLDWLQGRRKTDEVYAVLGGTMGRLAVHDAGLEDLIDSSSPESPSVSINCLKGEIFVLLNHAKNRQSAVAFGSQVASHIQRPNPVVFADFGGAFVTILINKKEKTIDSTIELAKEISERFSLELLELPRTSRGPTVINKNKKKLTAKRKVFGVLPGEPISVNGTIIGTAVSDDVEILTKHGRISSAKGIVLKEESLDRVGTVNLQDAVIRSGSIRRTKSVAAIRKTPGPEDEPNVWTVYVVHDAERSIDLISGTKFAITVGDDTTAISGDIFARYGIPVIGIVDGDLDGIAGGNEMAQGSIIVTVKPGNDDNVWDSLKKRLDEKYSSLEWLNIEEILNHVLEIAGDLVVEVRRT